MGRAFAKGAVAAEQAAEGEHVVGIELTRGLKSSVVWNATPLRRSKVYCSPSGLMVQRPASAGNQLVGAALVLTSWLKIWSVARRSTPLSELAGSKVLGLPVEQSAAGSRPGPRRMARARWQTGRWRGDCGQQVSWGFDLAEGKKGRMAMAA